MYTLKKKERARKYLKSMCPEGKSFDKFVDEINELIPDSSKKKYGEDPIVAAANYQIYVLVGRTKRVDEHDILSGGGMFAVEKNCELGDKGTIFTYLPLVTDTDNPETDKTGIAIRLGNPEPLLIDGEILVECITDKSIVKKNFSRKKKIKKAKSELTKRQEKDFKFAAKKLKDLLSKYGVTTVEDFSIELEMLLAIVPEDFLENFPDSKEGKIIAVYSYYEESKEEVEDLLASREKVTIDEKQKKSEEVSTVGTGTPFMCTTSKYGLLNKEIYLLYHEPEQDRFMLVPTIWLDPAYKVDKLLLGVLAMSFVTMTIALPPVGAAIFAIIPAASVAAPAVFATITGAAAASGVASTVGAATLAARAANNVGLAIRYYKGTKPADAGELDIVAISHQVDEVFAHEVVNQPDTISMSREVFEKLTKDGLLVTDNKLSKRLRYI